jgi:hypothetical protein
MHFMGEGLAFAKRTLPRKKPNTIDHFFIFIRSNGTCLFTPLPIRKVYHDYNPPDVGLCG